MADIATLEVRIDSSQTVKGAKALKDLAKAAKKTAKAEDDLSKSAKKADKSQKGLADSAEEVERSAGGAAKQVGKLGRNLDGTFRAAEALTPAQERAAKSAARMAKVMKFAVAQAVALAAALVTVRAAQDVIKVYAEFESTMATLRATLGETREGMSDLSDQAKQLGASTKFSASQAGEAQLALARAGQTQAEVLATTTEVLNLAAAANLGLGEAAEITSKTLAQFGKDASEAAHVTDVLVEAANKANTTVPKLAEALAQGGVIAAQTGKSLEETAAIIGILGNAGIEAGAGGTALRGAISALLRPAGQAASILKDLADRSGQASDAFDITAKSTTEVFKNLGRAGVTQAELVALFGREVVSAAAVIAASTDDIEALELRLKGVGTAAGDAAGIMSDTLNGSLAGLGSALDSAKISAGESGLGSAFRTLVDSGTILVRRMSGVEEGADKLSKKALLLANTIEQSADIATLGAITHFKLSKALTDVRISFSDAQVAVHAYEEDLIATTEASALYAGSINDVTSALKRQKSATTALDSPFNALQGQLLSARADVLELDLAIAKLEGGLAFELETAGLNALNTALAAGVREGLSYAEAQKRAVVFSQEMVAVLASVADRQLDLIAVQDRLSKSTKAAAEPVDKLAGFFDRLNDRLLDAVATDRVTRQVERLQAQFTALFEDKFGIGNNAEELKRSLLEIEDVVITSNKFEKLRRSIESGDSAARALRGSLAGVQAELSAGLDGDGGQAEALSEIAGARDEMIRSIDQQLLAQNLTIEEAKKERDAVNATAESYVQMRVEVGKLEDARTTLLEFNESIAEIADADLEDFPASLRDASDAIQELGKQREAAEATLEALDPANLKPGEFATKMDGIATAYEDGVSRLKIQGVVSELKGGTDQLVDNFGAAFTEIALGAEDVQQVFRDLGANLLNTALQSFVVEPILDQLKEGIGQALAEARGLANKGIEASSEVTAAAAVEASGLAVGTAAAGLTTSAGVVTTSATLMGTSAAALGTAGGVVTASAAAITAAAAALATAAAAAGVAAGAGAVAGVAANGAVVSSGAMMFAQGGVIDSPMSFPLRGGNIGIAGEAGPEAILPARRMGGGFEVEASIGGGETTTVPVRRLNSGKLGVKLFRHGGVVDTGAERTASLAQPTAGGRVFPAATEERTNVRNQSVVLNIATANPQAFSRSSRQMQRRMQRALR